MRGGILIFLEKWGRLLGFYYVISDLSDWTT